MGYYIRKIVGFIVTLFLVSLITFGVFQILPGNPVDVILGVDADPLQVEALTEELGLEKPIIVRYFDWLTDVLKGDLGNSFRYKQPVFDLIKSGMEVTGTLAVAALTITVLIGLPIGIFVAMNNKKATATVISMSSQLMLSIPGFCIGIVLIWIFTVRFRLFTSVGFVSYKESLLGCFRSIFLPALSIALGASAVLIRYIRVSILNQAKQEYVKTAYSKGLKKYRVMLTHVLRNSMIPVITILGMLTADILGGSIIIENVFSLPGIGKLISTSISTRDLPLIQGLVLYLAIIVVVCNFVVDMVYTMIDPRIRLE